MENVNKGIGSLSNFHGYLNQIKNEELNRFGKKIPKKEKVVLDKISKNIIDSIHELVILNLEDMKNQRSRAYYLRQIEMIFRV